MKLTPEEQEILEGKKGETLARIMKSVIRYGEIFGAEKLVPVHQSGHLVTSFGVSMLKPVYQLMDELIANGIKTKLPFTVDPRPYDHVNIKYSIPENLVFKIMYGKQKFYENQLRQVGLKDEKAFSCACYLKEVGNIPSKNDVIAWSESSAVVYANSVLGARTNRNSAIIDLFCGILGKTPYFGLLTPEGRKATWVIQVDTKSLPVAQLLGSTIGIKVLEDVPYIKGLDKHFVKMSSDEVNDYLKEMGAAAASNGAVGLFHVENVTPEAIEMGEELVQENATSFVIDDNELEAVLHSYEILWKNQNAEAEMCFIGCPHLSLNQLKAWTDKISEQLSLSGRKKLKIKTVLTSSPDVIDSFKSDRIQFQKLKDSGAKLSAVCPLMNMNNPLLRKRRVITNSNKLRTYSTARYYTDTEILNYITGYYE